MADQLYKHASTPLKLRNERVMQAGRHGILREVRALKSKKERGKHAACHV